MSFAGLLDKYTAFYRFVKSAYPSRLAPGLGSKDPGFTRVFSSCPPMARQNTLPLEGLAHKICGRFFSPNSLPMTDHLNPSTSHLGKRSEKSGFLSLSQISDLMAQGAVSQHQMLSEIHSSQLYATDLDEFVDFHAWQSVNVNPSTQQGVHA